MPFIITNSFKPDINREYPPSLHAPSNPFNYNLTDTGRKWVVNLIRRAQYGARPMKLPPFPRKGKAGGKKMRNTSQTWKALDHIPSIPLTHPPAVLLPWRLRAKLVTNFSRAEIKGGSRGEGDIYPTQYKVTWSTPPPFSRLWSRGRTIYYPGQLSNRSVNPCFTTWNRSWIQFSKLVFS